MTSLRPFPALAALAELPVLAELPALAAIPALAMLAGCHLFTGVDITCVAGEPCAQDSTGGDTGGDTAVEPAPSVGWVVSVLGGDGQSATAEAYSAAGELLKSWPTLGDAFEGVTPTNEQRFRGALSYNPDNGAGILGYGAYFVTLNYDGSVPAPVPVEGGEVYDVEVRYGGAWFAVGSQVYDYVFDPGEFTAMFGGTLEDATGLAYANERLYISACGGGTPDLWVLDAEGDMVDRLQDYDDNCGRGDNVFVGPDGEPWQCNSSGALYRIADVAEGNVEPAYLATGFSDVRDCAYDAGDDSFLLFDGARGLFRLRGGILTGAWEPTGSQRPGRAGFFHSGA